MMRWIAIAIVASALFLAVGISNSPSAENNCADKSYCSVEQSSESDKLLARLVKKYKHKTATQNERRFFENFQKEYAKEKEADQKVELGGCFRNYCEQHKKEMKQLLY